MPRLGRSRSEVRISLRAREHVASIGLDSPDGPTHKLVQNSTGECLASTTDAT